MECSMCQHPLCHAFCSAIEGFEQTQANVHECIKFKILLCPKSIIGIVQIHLKQFLQNCPNGHRKPSSYLIPGSWCVCDRARNHFLFLIFWWLLIMNGVKTKKVKNKDSKVLKHRIKNPFLLLPPWEQPRWFFYTVTLITSLPIEAIDGSPLLLSNQIPSLFQSICSPELIFQPYCPPDIPQSTTLFLPSCPQHKMFPMHLMPSPHFTCWIPASPAGHAQPLQLPGFRAWASSSICFNSILYETQDNHITYSIYSPVCFSLSSYRLLGSSMQGLGLVPCNILSAWFNAWNIVNAHLLSE